MPRRAAKGATAIMELGVNKNIDGFDKGNGAALINHSRANPNCFLLRQKEKVWLVAERGHQGRRGADL